LREGKTPVRTSNSTEGIKVGFPVNISPVTKGKGQRKRGRNINFFFRSEFRAFLILFSRIQRVELAYRSILAELVKFLPEIDLFI